MQFPSQPGPRPRRDVQSYHVVELTTFSPTSKRSQLKSGGSFEPLFLSQILHFPQPSSPREYLEPTAHIWSLQWVKESPGSPTGSRQGQSPSCLGVFTESQDGLGQQELTLFISFIKKTNANQRCDVPFPVSAVHPSQEPGWLEGTLNGKTGLIPENYVEFL